MLIPKTTIRVPNHLPKMKPPKRATGNPNPRKGNTQSIVKNKKIEDKRKKLEFFNSRKYNLLSLIKSYDVISWRLNFEKNKNKKIIIKVK